MLELLGLEPGALPSAVHVVVVTISVFLLAGGASWFVEAASRIGLRLGISELVIGLTVVAFGTSSPEFAVTVSSAVAGRGDISVANVVGSNIWNLGLILGLAALIRPLGTTPRVVWRDGGFLLLVTILLLVLVGGDASLDHTDGVILLVTLGAYLALLVKQRTGGPLEAIADEVPDEVVTPLWHDLVGFVGGLAAVLVGSNLLVDSATELARAAGVSDWVIGVTVVAGGTSAPELATSVVAALKNRPALGVGALIGSDIFNLLGVLGVAGAVHPVSVDPLARLSLYGLVGGVLLVIILMRGGWRVSRLDGALLIAVAVGRWVADFLLRAPS